MRSEFHQKIETLKRIQAEMKMELKNPVIILGKSKERLTNRTHQAEDRIVGLGDKID